jgi:hypothetical protein
VKFLSDGFELNQIDAAEPEIADMHPIPDNVQLSSCLYNYPVRNIPMHFLDQLKLCLQESELEQTFFGDFSKLFDQSLCAITLDNWPEAMRFVH